METNNWLEFIKYLNYNKKIQFNPKFFIILKKLIDDFNVNDSDIKIIRLYTSKSKIDTYSQIGFTVANKHYNSYLPLLSGNYYNAPIEYTLSLKKENNFIYFWNIRGYNDYRRIINSLVSINKTELASKLNKIFDLILKVQGKSIDGLCQSDS